MSERQPTSHERHAGEDWDTSYRGDGAPPWDIGRPQPAFARLALEGAFVGSVLDAGCGTGEHALLAAALGHSVLGFDIAETALARAREKAAARGLAAEFVTADALQLNALRQTFDTVLDCGLFHTFDAEERRAYVAGIAAVTTPGGRLHLLCFSDVAPHVPHPIREDELRAAFTDDWTVAALAPDQLVTHFATDGIPAWLAEIRRA